MKYELEARAIEIMKNATTPVIALMEEEGFPRASTISCLKTEGIEKAWFSTGLSTGKVRCIKNSGEKASLCFCDGENNVTLMGRITIRTEPEIKKEMWEEWFRNHFPGGETDPEYCILEFATEKAVFWIDRKYEENSLGRELVALEDHEGENPNPIILKKGEKVAVGERSDSEGNWPNWVFCTKMNGSGNGWTPLQILEIKGEEGTALDGYDAKELTVKKGDKFKGHQELNGWVWCSKSTIDPEGKAGNTTEEGWLPKEKIRAVGK